MIWTSRPTRWSGIGSVGVPSGAELPPEMSCSTESEDRSTSLCVTSLSNVARNGVIGVTWRGFTMRTRPDLALGAAPIVATRSGSSASLPIHVRNVNCQPT